MLTVGSLFSGIGGLELGLERAGMRVIWQVELDGFKRAVLAKHWPHSHRFADVRSVGIGNLEGVDVVCGGFPCTDISPAGKRAGIAGASSGLWSEMFRVVRDLRPRYVIVENSSDLVARGLDRVLADLASVGFDAEWDCLRAASFGAPHIRPRTFVVAYPHGESRRRQRRRVACPDEGEGARDVHPWAGPPPAVRVADGVPGELDRVSALGDAVVPQVAQWIGERILEYEEGRLAA